MYLFRGLVHKALKEGMLQFREKPKASMQVDSNPLQVEETHFDEPIEIQMVEATEGFDMEVEQV